MQKIGGFVYLCNVERRKTTKYISREMNTTVFQRIKNEDLCFETIGRGVDFDNEGGVF